MIYFSWRKFCDAHGVQYVERGPNTMHGHLTIKCPLCVDDPSQHCNVNSDPRRPGWSCLRNSKHRGHDPTYLVKSILKCSKEAAQEIVTQQRPSADAFNEVMDKLMDKPSYALPVEVRRGLALPSSFKPIGNSGYGPKFLRYLESRGFDDPISVAHRYKLHYCLTGSYQWRLIIPFLDQGKVVGWTGRHIGGDELRYLTLPFDPDAASNLGCEPALVEMESYVWRRDLVEIGNRGLLIVEGPMDALKVDFYKQRVDVTVTCVFGKPKSKQVEFLGRCARSYDVVVVALDADASHAEAWSFADQLEELAGGKAEVVAVPLPDGVKDPGSMTQQQVRELMREF